MFWTRFSNIQAAALYGVLATPSVIVCPEMTEDWVVCRHFWSFCMRDLSSCIGSICLQTVGDSVWSGQSLHSFEWHFSPIVRHVSFLLNPDRIALQPWVQFSCTHCKHVTCVEGTVGFPHFVRNTVSVSSHGFAEILQASPMPKILTDPIWYVSVPEVLLHGYYVWQMIFLLSILPQGSYYLYVTYFYEQWASSVVVRSLGNCKDIEIKISMSNTKSLL